MTEDEREHLEWRIKHSRETAEKARLRGDIETYDKLKGYISMLEKELAE